MRKKNEDQLATAIAATEAREAAYKNKPRAFVIKEPVVGFSSASGSSELDTPHGAWQLLDSYATIDTLDREDETKTAVCADPSKTAVVTEDPATRDSHVDATVAHTSPLNRLPTVLQRQSQSQSLQDKTANEPVATATFAECVKQSPDLQRSCINVKEEEPQQAQPQIGKNPRRKKKLQKLLKSRRQKSKRKKRKQNLQTQAVIPLISSVAPAVASAVAVARQV